LERRRRRSCRCCARMTRNRSRTGRCCRCCWRHCGPTSRRLRRSAVSEGIASKEGAHCEQGRSSAMQAAAALRACLGADGRTARAAWGRRALCTPP
jgi:hypothetical protein